MAENGIGASVRRKEDFRFLTGRGTYVYDIDRPRHLARQCYARSVRSFHPCVEIGAAQPAAAAE